MAEAAEALAVLFDWVAILDSQGQVQKVIGAIPYAGHVGEVVQELIAESREFLAGRPLDLYREWEIGGTKALYKIRSRRIPGYTDVVLAVARASESEQKAHERSLLAREFEFISANLRQGICRLDAQGRIIWANQFLSGWLEVPGPSLLGRSLSDHILLSESVPDFASMVPAGSFECDIASWTGLTRWCRVHHMPVQDNQGGHTGTFLLVVDISGERAIQARFAKEIREMASLASLDPLTGLVNRRTFDQGYQQAMEHAGQEPFGIVLLDLDNLKDINDTYGHEAGDLALRSFASRLRSILRDSDWVARIGGDEFAVLLPGITRPALRDLTSRLEAEMQFGCEWAEQPLLVEASVGSAHSDDGVTAVLPTADAAMYAQKRRRQQARQRK